MVLTDRRRKLITGMLLTVGVVLLRLPFIAEYLFEFDSVDFAIATFRFDLAQFTPHPPGYILHVLLGRWLANITSDINLAFIWLAILLSVGSVLFLWRAAAHLRGERVGLIVAVIWLFAPMFWFYGEVATSYTHEAFFASALLYYGVRLLRDGAREHLVYSLLLTFSLAIAARQSSILFFGPAILYLLVKARPSVAVLLRGLGMFLIISIGWTSILISESGGLSRYLEALSNERLYTTQSVLFGNSAAEHLGVLTKLLWFLLIGALPVILIGIYGLLAFRGEMLRFIREGVRSQMAPLILVLILPPLLFYALIYFMKAGYLLNILPALFLAGGVMLDQIAILHAKSVRLRDPAKVIFTRRLITQFSLILVFAVMNIEIIWFTFPLPGKQWPLYANLFSHQTFRESMEARYAGQADKSSFFLNKAFAYSSSAGVRNIDSIHHLVKSIIGREHPDEASTVIFDTWWQRFSYFYFPKAVCYDIRSYEADTLFSGLRMHDYTFEQLHQVNEVPVNSSVFILIRQEHPDLRTLQKQVRLTKLNAPPFIDIYKVEDSVFMLRWKNRTFVKR